MVTVSYFARKILAWLMTLGGDIDYNDFCVGLSTVTGCGSGGMGGGTWLLVGFIALLIISAVVLAILKCKLRNGSLFLCLAFAVLSTVTAVDAAALPKPKGGKKIIKHIYSNVAGMGRLGARCPLHWHSGATTRRLSGWDATTRPSEPLPPSVCSPPSSAAAPASSSTCVPRTTR